MAKTQAQADKLNKATAENFSSLDEIDAWARELEAVHLEAQTKIDHQISALRAAKIPIRDQVLLIDQKRHELRQAFAEMDGSAGEPQILE